MSDIFLSYKSEEKAKAKTIAEALERKGYSVWWDRKIPPGKTYDDVIEEELGASKCVMVLWSNGSVKSEWVKDEASEGKRRNILVPVMIEDVLPPLTFRRIEAAKLIDWYGTSDHEEFDLLLESVTRIVGRPPEVLNIKTGGKALEAGSSVKTNEIEEENFTNPNSIGMKFVLIPAGEFMMGSNEYDSEKPVHKVSIGESFYLGIYPVTQQEWTSVMKNNPSRFQGNNMPVEQVSWNVVQDFIKKLNEKEGGSKYRLPTEAEWEYAARAGTTTRYSFGDDESKLGDYAWYYANSGSTTHEVGQKKPNPWGLYDMHGNVWEWVQDKWHNDYNGAPTDGSSWESGDSSFRVIKGGSWSLNSGRYRSANRNNGGDPSYRGRNLGFRLVRIL